MWGSLEESLLKSYIDQNVLAHNFQFGFFSIFIMRDEYDDEAKKYTKVNSKLEKCFFVCPLEALYIKCFLL